MDLGKTMWNLARLPVRQAPSCQLAQEFDIRKHAAVLVVAVLRHPAAKVELAPVLLAHERLGHGTDVELANQGLQGRTHHV